MSVLPVAHCAHCDGIVYVVIRPDGTIVGDSWGAYLFATESAALAMAALCVAWRAARRIAA